MFPMPMYGRGPIAGPMRTGLGGPAQPWRDPSEGRGPMPIPEPPIQRFPVLGTMHKGGKVPKTGPYQLKKGEHVLPKGAHKLTAKTRNALPAKTFGLPGQRKYPMPDKSHAANAKARATQMVKRGKLSGTAAARIRRKANGILGEHKLVSVSALKA